jgi:hypothetical protein
MMRRHFYTLLGFLLAICAACIPCAQAQHAPSSGAGVPKWSPAQKPTMVGPIDVGVVLVLFPDTELAGGIARFKADMDRLSGLTQEEYFKIYSNDIVWPVVKLYPNEDDAGIFRAPECYGYYCKYDYWSDPIGWHDTEEGQKRAGKLKAEALAQARARAPGGNFRAMAVCYITTFNRDRAARPDIRRYYAAACGRNPQDYPDPTAKQGIKAPKADPPELMMSDKKFDPWDYYHPSVAWGEPMWPNSSIQFNNASAGTFAHEFGHVLGAPDIYRIGRANDGINGTPVLMAYGPTATAFSRFYHHGFVSEKNYPMISTSGTYTLYPRHIKPEKDEALGFIISSRHPHYFYHIEYIYGEKPALRGGGGDEVQNRGKLEHLGLGGVEGVLISAINLGESNYLGSPDGFYTYRPNDPWFRGVGDLRGCLFGFQVDRQEFNMQTEPSSRLPNLMDGGVHFKNITEHQGTATFDVEIDKAPLTSAAYQQSLLPQIQLEPIDQLLPTSFRMTATIKFRGEPLLDQFGMCWGTSKNPDVGAEHFTLANCNYDMCFGRALNLKPNTKYYVRGWAANVKGIRYSDEELEVKTPSLTADIQEVEPLLLDSFSNNGTLHEQFSYITIDRYGHKNNGYESYAPTAVLAKLAAYYHPENLPAPHSNVAPNPQKGDALGPGHELIVPINPNADKSKSSVNFGRLHWDPHGDDPSWRTVETLALFEEMHHQARSAKMYDLTLGTDFLAGFGHMFKHKMQPQFQPVTAQNLDETLKLIKTELINARPVLVIESPQPHTNTEARIQWGLIDGFQSDGSVHIDFPLDTEFLKQKRQNFTTLNTLVLPKFDLAIVTHISI